MLINPQINYRHWVTISAFFVLIGCASYQSKVGSARSDMEQGRYTEAVASLKEKVDEASGDRLAYLLEYATVLHQAGRYKESNKAFLEADKIAEINDYTSISREFGAVMLQEGLAQFKVETFEFLLINIYQALNYIMLGDYENAQVMGRRLNDKLNKIEMDGDSKKRQNVFAMYLAGMMWEAQGDSDNAQIMYSRAHALMPEIKVLRRDWLISAQRSQRPDTVRKITKKYPYLRRAYDWKKLRGQGELVFIFQQGWAPRKRARPENRRFPMVARVSSDYSRAEVSTGKASILSSERVYDLDIISRQVLEANFAILLAKKAAGIAAKATLGHQMNKKNPGLGDLLFIALDAADQADLRQWSTLPASFQVARTYLTPGKHQVKIRALGRGGPKILWEGEVDIVKGKKVFITQRAF